MAGEVDFTPTEEDYVASNLDWADRHIRRRVPVMLAGATLIFFGFVWLFTGGVAPWITLVSAIVFGLMLVPTLLFVFSRATSRSARRLFRQQRTLHKAIHYRWSDEALEYKSTSGVGHVAWADLYRWHDGKNAVLFLLNARLYYFLPHRALTPSQTEDLRATVTAFGPSRL